MSSIDFLKTSNFSIQFKNQKTVEFLVTDISLPSITLSELTLSRPVIIDRRPGESLSFGDLTFTMICDEDLKAYKEIYDSLISAANPKTAVIDPFSVVFDATLFLTTNKNNIKHRIIFYDAFFKEIGSINLSSSSTDDGFFKIDCSCGFVYYEFK